MVKVSSVTTVRGRVVIELDDGRRYKIRNSDLAGFPVYENMEMEDSEFERKILLCQYPEALNAAVAMLARRACSRREIRDRLLSRGWCQETVDMVFAKLDQQNLLDDRDFSDQWTRYRASGNYGTGRIYRELRSKGIDEETALESIGSVSPEDQLESASALAMKAASRSKPGEDLFRIRNRVLQALIRRGFSWDIARAACDRAFRSSEEE